MVKLRSEAIDKFRIEYVAGFESSMDGFAHFLTVQPDQFRIDHYAPVVSASRSSRLVRVCERDPSFFSYVEIPLRCRDSGGTEYQVVRAGTLVRGGPGLASRLRATSSPSSPPSASEDDQVICRLNINCSILQRLVIILSLI